jgi:toxin ParE1/3/4
LRVIRTSAADEDLIRIWLYIAQHNPKAADAILDRLEARFHILEQFPQAGVARGDIGENIRQLVEGDYVIFYRPTAKLVEILRVLHTRQRQDREILNP